MSLTAILTNKPQLSIATLVLSITTLASITILTGTILASTYVSADDNSTVDQISITVPESCTMSGTGMDSHNASINNGLYVPDIGTTTLHAFCNDNEGFAIYAAGYTGNEIGGTNSNKLVGTAASNNATIESGIATTAGNPDISNWAMKLAITQDSGDTTGTNAFVIDSAPNVALPSTAESGATSAPFSQYHMVPNEYTKVAHKNSGTDMTTTTGGVKLTTTYAAYISKTQPADTYSGQVIYTLVHPASASAPAAPVSCNPTGTTIGTNSGTDIKCMQDINSSNKSSILTSMTEDVQHTLVDKRDEKTYTIAKLRDGNIWMTQNLDLDLDSTKTYTNEDTDLGWNDSSNSYSTASWTPTHSTYVTSDTTWVNSDTTPESYDPGDYYWNGTFSGYGGDTADWEDCGNNTQCLERLFGFYTSSTGIPQRHLGNYYNFSASVAINNTSLHTTDGELIDQSICPSGWTLPRVGTGEDTFYALFREYGFSFNQYGNAPLSNNGVLWTSPLYYSNSGMYEGQIWGVGLMTRSQSSVISSNNYNYTAAFGADDYAGLQHSNKYGWRQYGYAIRCLARPASKTIELSP